MSLFSKALGNADPLDPQHVRQLFSDLFLDYESVELAFSLFRDVIVLTDLRYIEVDVQGLRGRKVHYLSLPYVKITGFSVESAGSFDLDADLKIWALGVPPLSSDAKAAGCTLLRKFSKGVDIYLVQRLLAHHTCGGPVAGTATADAEVVDGDAVEAVPGLV